MMLTKNPESISILFPSSKSKKKSSTRSSVATEETKDEMMTWNYRHGVMIIVVVVIIVMGLLLYFFVIAKKKKKTIKTSALAATSAYPSLPFAPPSTSQLDTSSSVARFKNLRIMWTVISQDRSFLILAKTLMDINSSALDSKSGNQDIFIAYKNLDHYVKTKMNLRGGRIKLIYLDGIVYYDSSLDLAKTYFMANGLPIPATMNTLGSPLKDHNTLPENFNSLMVHPSQPENMVLMGMSVSDPLYKELFQQGFGFIERISSNMAIPYTYLSHYLLFSIDPLTSFPHGCTLSVSMPIGLM